MDQATETKNQVVDDDGGLKRTASRGSFQEPDAVPPADHGVANSVDLEAQPEPVGPPIPVVDPEAQHEQQAAADNDQEKLNWAVKMIVFCLPPAVAIAVQSLKTNQSHELPLAFHFLSVALILSFNSLFLSKFIAPREIAKLLERIGVFLAIAISNTALSVQNFKADMAVPSALGLDPTVANSVHQIINHAVGPILPSVIQKEVLDRIFKVDRAQLSESLLNESNPLGSSRLAYLRCVFEEGSLQLQFPTFLQRILVSGISKEHLFQRFSLSYTDIAGLLLFLVIEEIISTLDLVSGDKIKFLLINAPLEDSLDLARSAFKVAEDFKVSIKLVNDVPSTLEISQLDIHIITTKDDYNRRYMKMLNFNDPVLPVLIVGAGPVGLVLSMLLTKLGIKCSVCQKNEAFSKHPQAHFINNRSMEVDFLLWVMNAEVAEKYVCCDSRIILAGDAAHRFPPAGGFGMNTGIQDAHQVITLPGK
ncbi:hypothetical protein Q3G72_003033 [Acer saccharum]|nr:hypothetical protein Q3G72_003033 [Acer saccharum]